MQQLSRVLDTRLDPNLQTLKRLPLYRSLIEPWYDPLKEPLKEALKKPLKCSLLEAPGIISSWEAKRSPRWAKVRSVPSGPVSVFGFYLGSFKGIHKGSVKGSIRVSGLGVWGFRSLGFWVQGFRV